MKSLTLNETPVRTARNFLINNIELKNINLPENLKSFENIEIVKNNSEICENISNKPLIYGLGKELEDIVKKANHKIKITTNEEHENISIVYEFDEENLNLVNEIEIEANGSVNIIIEYKGITSKECFHKR